MASVYAMVLPTEQVGNVECGFSAEGHLETVKLRSGKAPGITGRRPTGAPKASEVRAWLRAYLRGEDGPFPGKWRNPGRTPFAKEVYRVVARLKAGRTLSYGKVALKAGSPGASRAVGNAMGRNPLPLVVP